MFYGNTNVIDIKSKKYSVSGHRSICNKRFLYILGGYTTKKDEPYRISRKESFKISMSTYEISNVQLSLPSFFAMTAIDDYIIVHGGIFYKYENKKQKIVVSSSLHFFRWENNDIEHIDIKKSLDNTPVGLYHHQSAFFARDLIVYFGGISEDDKDEELPNDSIYFLKMKLKGNEIKSVKWVDIDCSNPEISPRARTGHTLVSHANTETCILYGGKDKDDKILSDIYILICSEDNKYEWIQPVFPKPSMRLPPLYGHCMEEYNDDCYIIYGGETDNFNTNSQIYIFTMLKYPIIENDDENFYVSLSKPLLSNGLPSPSLNASMSEYKGTIYIFGGNLDDEVLNDFYEYTITDKLIETEKPRGSSLYEFLKELNLLYLLDVFLKNKIQEKNDLDYVSEKQYIEMGLKLGEYRLIMKNIGFIKRLDNCVVKDFQRNDLMLFNKKDIKKFKIDGSLGDEESEIFLLDNNVIGMKESSVLDRLKEIKDQVGDTSVDLKGFKAYNCVVCQDNLSKYAFIPCGHYGACEECCNLLKAKPVFKCPFCSHKDPEIVEVKLPPNDDYDED